MIGSLGGIVFETSIERVRTFNEMARKRSVEYAEHAIHSSKGRVEFIRHNLDDLTFSIRLDASHGVNPKKELDRLGEKMNRAEVVDLLLGEDYKGAFVITGLDEAWKHIDKHGNILVADVAITMKEYTPWNMI